MSIAREKIMETRRKMEAKRAKDEARMKKLQERLRQHDKVIQQTQKKEDIERKILVGGFILEKAKSDASFQTWLEDQINSSPLSAADKNLLLTSKEQSIPRT